jgi:hypothetical protein
MATFLQLTLWNANDLTQHTDEPKTFISIHNIHIMLISEMHFTDKSYLKLPNYTVCHTTNPAATAIIIKNSNKHHQLNNFGQDFLQATSVLVEDSVGLLTISAVYLPPKYTVKREHLEDFYITLGRHFIAGRDYNAKHTKWQSGLITLEDAKYSKQWKTYL